MSNETVKNMMKDVKMIGIEEEDLQKELLELRGDLKDEERQLYLAKQDKEVRSRDVEIMKRELENLQKEVTIVGSFREKILSTLVMLKQFTKFVENAQPHGAAQQEQVNKMETAFTDKCQQYEKGSSYQAILQEEIAEKELSKLIEEKKKEIMKLETSIEY